MGSAAGDDVRAACSDTDLARTCGFAYTCGVACGAERVANRLANPPGGCSGSQDLGKTPGRRVSGGDRACASGRKSGVQMRWPTQVDRRVENIQVKETNE